MTWVCLRRSWSHWSAVWSNRQAVRARLKCVSIRLWCGCRYQYCSNLLWRGCVYVGVGVTEAQCEAADKQSERDWSASQSGAWRRPEVQVAAAEGARRRQGDLTEPRSYSITRGVSFLLVPCIVSNSLNISWHCCTCPWGLRSRVLTRYHLICLKTSNEQQELDSANRTAGHRGVHLQLP